MITAVFVFVFHWFIVTNIIKNFSIRKFSSL